MTQNNYGKQNRINTIQNNYQKTLRTMTIITITLSSLFSACESFPSKNKETNKISQKDNINDSIRKKTLQDSVSIYENLGLKSEQEGDISTSIKHYLQALHYHKLLGNKKQEQIITKNIGLLYFQQKNYDKYLEYMNKALQLAKEINYEYGIRYANLILGDYEYEIKKNTDFALTQYFLPGWEAIKSISNQNQKQKLTVYYACDIASCYMDNGNHKEAYKFRNEAEKGNIILKDTNITITINQNKGVLERNQKNYQNAEKNLLLALSLSKETKQNFRISQTLLLLSDLYEIQDKPKQALKYYKESMKIDKELNNEEAARTQQEIETKLKTTEKEYEIIKQQAQIEKQEETNKKMTWGYIAALAVILGFGATTITYRIQKNKLKKEKDIIARKNEEITRKNEEITHKNEEIENLNKHLEEEKATVEETNQILEETNQMLEEKNTEVEAINNQLAKTNNQLEIEKNNVEEMNTQLEIEKAIVVEKNKIIEEKQQKITDSIRYASHIQRNILPEESEVKKLFPESFILYMPKDIVSGDFYRFKETKSGKVAFAAIDCVGHGVPGAFLTVIANTILTNAIKSGLESPSDILKYLDNNIGEYISSDRQKSKSKEESDLIEDAMLTRETMDIALCCYNPKTQILEYAGIHNPIYITYENEFIQLNADQTAIGIGGVKGYKETDTKSKKIEKGSTIYLFSDGYADQFGDDTVNGRKIKMQKKNFRGLVARLSKLPIDQQKEAFEKHFHERKGSYPEQIDDVLVMGIKV